MSLRTASEEYLNSKQIIFIVNYTTVFKYAPISE